MANRVELEAILKFVGVKVNPGVFNQISRAAAGMPGPVQQFNRNLSQSIGTANNLNKTLRGVNAQLTGSQRAAQLFLQRMAQFAILLPTFATLNKSIQGGIKFLFEFDAAIKDIIRVDIASLGDQFDEIAKSAFNLASQFGVSAVVAADTIKLYKQAGFELKEANELAELSLLATKASTLDAGQAVEFLLSATKQFKLEGDSLKNSLDALVKTEDLSALEARDIADAFKTGGNSLAVFGKDINDAIGLIAALREQTRKSGNEIGTFFKTLQTRIFAAGESRTALEQLGVSVQNLDGSLRPTLAVLNDLKIRFDKLTEAEQANAAKAIAGVRQFEELIGTLQSLDRANALSAESSNAAGSARTKEAVDATKLQRRLDDLIVAGQKLAFALGEAGSTDFFKNALKGVTGLVDGLTEIVKLLDKFKVPILPILAPLALKGLDKVFGLGLTGSGKGGGGGGKGGGFPGGGIGQNTNDLTANTAALKQLTIVIDALAQQIKLASGALMNQAGASQVAAAATNMQTQATNTHIQATRQAAVVAQTWTTRMAGSIPTLMELQLLLAGVAAKTKQVLTMPIGGGGSKSGSGSSDGVKSAAMFAALTIAGTALTAGLNNLADSLGGNSSFAGSLAKTTSAATQMSIQFAAFGPVAAGVAGALGAIWDSSTRLVDAFKEEKAAREELRAADKKSFDTRRGVSNFGKSPDNAALAFGKSIEGRTKQNINYDTSFQQMFAALDAGTKKAVGDAQTLKEAYFTNSLVEFTGEVDEFGSAIEKVTKGIGEDLIRGLAFADDALIKNQDAIDELRASYNASGRSSLEYKKQQELVELAYGRLAKGAAEAAKQIEFLQMTFDDMKKLQDLIASAQEVNDINRDTTQNTGKPQVIAEGIDALSQTARNAKSDLANAQKAFDDLLSTLQTAGSDSSQFNAFASMEEAKKFLGDIGALLAKPNNGAAISNFLGDRKLTDAQKTFAEEYIKIEKDRAEAVNKSKSAEAAFSSEALKRNLEETKAQKEASLNAAESLGKFRAELAKVGAQANASGDTGLMSQITNLKSSDVQAALAGGTDLPKVLQDVITSTFIDGVKKAETDLSQISDELAAAVAPINNRIQELADEIKSLGVVAPNTEKAAKKAALQQELAAKTLEKQNVEQDAFVKSLEGVQKLTVETKKAQEEAARAEAERLKKTQALTNATQAFARSVDDVNRSFADFATQRIDTLAQDQANAYEEVKSAQQGVISSTEELASAYASYISAIIQVNGVIAEAKIRANLLGRDIGMLNGNIVSFQDKLGTLDDSFRSVLDDANMSLEQRINLERQLAEQTLSFLQQAQDEIVNAGLNIFGQSAQENQGLQKGIAALSFVAEKLGGSFQNFLGMDASELGNLSQELLNLPVEFRKSILDALSFLPSTTSIGGFSADQLKQAIGQVGAGVAPEEGLPAISELTAQQVEQLKILGQLGTEEAKMQLSQVIAAQKQLEKAQEQLDISKIQEERAREGFEQVRLAVLDEMAVIDQANTERRELLQKVIEADNANTLNAIANEAQLFSDQNSVFREVGDTIVAGVGQAISAKMAMLEAQIAMANFNTNQSFSGNYKGYIPNFAAGNLSPGEAAGILRAAAREKKMMPNGADLAVANTKEAIIPMYKNFANGNAGGSSIAASVNSIRMIDPTMVAAIASSVSNSLSQIRTDSGSEQVLDKIAGLLTELNTGIGQVRDSSLAIKTNTAGLATATETRTPGVAAAGGGQEININLQTNQNSTVQITGLESLREQLRIALSETTDKQVAKQLEVLMSQLDPLFQALNERGIISSFGQSR
jgi:TP901 family phage tail tape measure protein